MNPVIIIPEMLTIDEQVAQIQEILRKTPHHKATNGFIGAMRAKIARLRDRELDQSSKGGGGGGGFQVKKQGDATVVLVGPPSAGKSTLINKLTNAESKVAPYAFTTVTVVPGMLKYKEAYIQILDIPGLIEGARSGKGRGKEVLSVARSADLLIVMSDVERVDRIPKMIEELKGAGIRINETKPDIMVEKKTEGGLEIKSNLRQDLDKETIKQIAREYGLNNGTITLKEKVTFDRLFDALSENRVYIPAIFVLNKSENSDNSNHQSQYIRISAKTGKGLDKLKERMWSALEFVTIFLVRLDEASGTNNPMVVKANDTLKDVSEKIGEEFAARQKLVKIWGSGAKFPGQEVSFSTKVEEGMQIRFLQ